MPRGRKATVFCRQGGFVETVARAEAGALGSGTHSHPWHPWAATDQPAHPSARGPQEVRAKSRRKGDCAGETIRVPVEPHVATLTTSYHGVNHMSAKTLVRRRVDGWTSRLSPAEQEPTICRARPLDANPAPRPGQSTVFCRI